MLSKKVPLKKLDEDTMSILYKLLHDSLFALIIFFILTLIAEGILPGIIISHIGFSKLVFLLFGNVLLLKFLAKKITPDRNAQSSSIENKSLTIITISLSVLGALLILNSQLGVNIFLNIFILLITSAIGYLSYHVLFHGE